MGNEIAFLNSSIYVFFVFLFFLRQGFSVALEPILEQFMVIFKNLSFKLTCMLVYAHNPSTQYAGVRDCKTEASLG